MKLLYTLIILSAFSFAEDELHLLNGTIYYGLYGGTSNYQVLFKAKEMPAMQSVNIAIIDFLIDDGITITKQDLQSQNVIELKNTNKQIDSKKGYLGGLLIAVGGGFLFSNLDKEMNDDETIEDFADRVNGTAKIGYGLIIIGGLLVAMGI